MNYLNSSLIGSNNLFYFLASLVLALSFTKLVIYLAKRLKILDWPDQARKLHKQATPLLGGLAIFLAFFLILSLFKENLVIGDLKYSHWCSVFLGALVLMIGGFLDDKYNIAARYQIVFPVLAAIIPILGGVNIAQLSNPLGENLVLSSSISAIFIFIWLLALMYSTKLLDGLDGLVSGLGVIGSFIIFLFSSSSAYNQQDIAFVALVFSAACLGFLIYNFSPAKIFLGEGGSLLVGYILGVLAVISGGKIAIALLIMGLPVLDLIWTILRRLYRGKNPFKTSDRKHLHYRLQDLGLSTKQTVLIFYSFSFLFGISGLFLQSQGKLLALFILASLLLLLIIFFQAWERWRLPRALLHVCCAPCASLLTKAELLGSYRLTWLFYNPNLSSKEEYDKRLGSVKKAAKILGVKLVVIPYNHQDWRSLVSGYEKEIEGGKRCKLCYRERLNFSYNYAKKHGFKNFSTSLLTSPYKDRDEIRKIMTELNTDNLTILANEWGSIEDYRASLAWARENLLYLQNYCGCEFSFNNKSSQD